MYGPVQHSYISFWNVRRSGAISLVLWELRLWNFNTIWIPYLCLSWQKIINISSIEREKWLPDHLTSEMGYTCVSWPIQLRELNSYLMTRGGRGAAPRCRQKLPVLLLYHTHYAVHSNRTLFHTLYSLITQMCIIVNIVIHLVAG